MNSNHDDHAKRAGRDEIASRNGQNRPDSTGNGSRSRIASAYGQWLVSIAGRLDWLRAVPNRVLGCAVAEHGACMEPPPDGDPPTWLFDATSDRELAARLCAGCPVQDECLEFELRVYGTHTDGVWGALSEDDRRALHPYWRRRREALGHTDPDDDAPSCGTADIDGSERR